MDQKAWLWKKRSTEKTLVAEKATNSSSRRNEEATEELLTEKAELERDLRVLNDKLSSAVSECNSKDGMAKKQVKIAQEAIAGWEKAETEAIALRNDLDITLRQKAASDEKLGHLEAALKECMQQLRFVREEQEKRIQSALVKTSEESEIVRLALEQDLAEAGKRLAKLDAENTQLKKALPGKDKVIEELSKCRAQAEVDLNALMLRMESTEKENGSLKYEVRVLEKELDIRNEETEFNQRTSDVAQTKYQESVKKIANLESECQRLRILVQKRLPGPAAVKKMKNEVEMLGRDSAERRRRKSNASTINLIDMAVDTPSKRIDFLTEQLQKLEEENKCLKYYLSKKPNELQFSRARQSNGKSPFFLQEKSVGVSSDVGSDDKASFAESWASALISELEHFKNEKQSATPSHRNMGASEMNLMEDFAEMEKMAVVSVDYPPESSSEVSEFVLQTSPVKPLNLPDTRNENSISTPKKSSQKLEPNVSISVRKILNLLEGINISSQDSAKESLSRKDVKFLPYKSSDTPTGYTVRVFQWRSDDLSAILQQFTQTCNDLLNGTADLEQFTRLVASNLDWVMNHCFSIQDVSSMKDTIKSHLDWDESRSETEVDNGSANHSAESNRQQNIKGESLKTQHQDPEGLIRDLQPEMETVNQSEGRTGDQIEKQMIKENRETHLVETNLGQTQNISDVENDHENESNSSKRLEETCNDIKLQVKSMTREKVPDQGEHVVTQLRSDWEITAASAKLAECQETILNLGKQLKALASPRDAAIFDRVTSTPADSHRLSLRDKIQPKESDHIPASPRAKDDNQNGNGNSSVSTVTAMESWSKFTDPQNGDDNTVAPMAIVPLKKTGGRSFWKKLFWQHTKGNSKKRPSRKLK